MATITSSNGHCVLGNEVEDQDGDLELCSRVSDLNRCIEGLGQEVSELVHEDGESNEKLKELKRRIEEFKDKERNLNRSVEEIEAQVFALMLESEKNGGKFGESSIAGFGGFNKEEYDLGHEEFEALKEIYGRTDDIGINLAQLQAQLALLRSEKNESGAEFGEVKPVLDKLNFSKMEYDGKAIMGDGFGCNLVAIGGMNVEDMVDMQVSDTDTENVQENSNHQLQKEIELLELMLARGTVGLLDLQIMADEIQGLKVSKTEVRELEPKFDELQEGLWEVRKAIMELKTKKMKELVEKKNKMEKDAEKSLKGLKCLKLNWPILVAATGSTLVALAALLLLGSAKTRVKKNVQNQNKHH
ncbi:peroxisomal and mitochondrial division factor 2-like [Quillaja saponaria]|uniref:Peroxisomal and mitochondrial division factor 2-like n=1 Tax=Quillaja saponaria TaxID=32244 RepID=A0AAD7M2Q8_QUISA|nr:peroxisomal and mitochondrial division factor 2-like [Quillaja saponaria]